MKKISFLFVLFAIISSPIVAQQNTSSGISLNSAVDSACYAFGIRVGSDLREQMKSFPGAGGEVNMNALVEGLVRAITNDFEALLIPPEEAQAYFQSYIMGATARDAEIAKEEEIRFLAENKTKEGVITTESGLQYRIISQGEGDKPTREDMVTVNYIGMLLDGAVFDASQRRGQPLTIGVSEVIEGWGELLQLMPVGSKYTAWIPSALAYGESGFQSIKPNTTLIFEVELLNIEK